MEKIRLIVIAGPTASGKTALGVAVSKALGGEVVSADSMQVYQGMDIATAKPTAEEMQGVPHHLIDIIPPDAPFSVADFQSLAAAAIRDITRRGKLPVVVGGTGLYIDTLVDNVTLSETSPDPDVRRRLEQLAETEGTAAMLETLRSIDPAYAASLHENDGKRIIRALELWETSKITMSEQLAASRRNPSPYDATYLCLDAEDRNVLYGRIDRRVDAMLAAGLEEEARRFFDRCGKTAVQAIGYKELAPYFRGEITREDAVASLKQSTRRYAKRQLTWFRRRQDAYHLYIDRYETAQALCEDALRIIQTRERESKHE